MQTQKVAQGTGVVKAIDTANGTVTLHHHAIAAIHWPAMTMTFKVDPSSPLKRVKVGEEVTFTLRTDGMYGTVAIAPAQ
ncbi:MAG TPA: copper-binding protein [Rhodanobacteraceae bacterium]